jgi:hypothetical protein
MFCFKTRTLLKVSWASRASDVLEQRAAREPRCGNPWYILSQNVYRETEISRKLCGRITDLWAVVSGILRRSADHNVEAFSDVILRVCLKWWRLVGHSCGQVLTARPRVAPTWAQQTVRSAPHCRHVFWCSTALQALQAPLAVLPQFRTLAPASRLLSLAQRFPDYVRREFCQGFWGSTPTKKIVKLHGE